MTKGIVPSLAWLPPTLRLLVVVVFSVLPFLADEPIISGVVCAVGAVAAATAPMTAVILRRPVMRLIFLPPVITGVMYLVGNALFSPESCNSASIPLTFWMLRINECGIDRGVVTGPRISGVMFMGIAWVLTNTPRDMFSALHRLPGADHFVLQLTRRLQLTLRENNAIGQGLTIRGLRIMGLFQALKADPAAAWQRNTTTFLSLLRAVLPRFMRRTAEFAYAWESHFPVPRDPVPGAPVLEVSDLDVYPRSGCDAAVSGVRLELCAGDFVLVVGDDGSGKSMLLKAIAGVIPSVEGLRAGRVLLEGHDTALFRISDYAGLVCYFSQDAATHTIGLTVDQQLRLSVPDAELRGKLAGAMGLDRLLDREVTHLSGGESVRLLLTHAMAHQARLLVFDTPLDQLDAEGRGIFLSQLAQIVQKRKDVTVILAEPRLDLVSGLANKVWVVEKGGVTEFPAAQVDWSDHDWRERAGGLFGDHMDAIEAPWHRDATDAKEACRPLVELQSVTVEVDGIALLHEVSMEVFPGEIVVVRGPNGSGKTTAMLTLAGAMNHYISRGERRVHPNVHFGYVFQDVALQLVAATVERELDLTQLSRAADGAEDTNSVLELLSWVGVDRSRDPSELHPSQQKKLATAAMMVGARVVVVDEPTVGAGAEAAMSIVRKLIELRQAGCGVVVISHDEHIQRIGDRIYEFVGGRACRVIASTRNEEV